MSISSASVRSKRTSAPSSADDERARVTNKRFQALLSLSLFRDFQSPTFFSPLSSSFETGGSFRHRSLRFTVYFLPASRVYLSRSSSYTCPPNSWMRAIWFVWLQSCVSTLMTALAGEYSTLYAAKTTEAHTKDDLTGKYLPTYGVRTKGDESNMEY